MYTIIVYDVEQKRVGKVCQFLRRYLNWIQNSVFEGELSKGQLKEVKMGLRDIIKKDEDSIIFFTAESEKWLKKEVMGIEKSEVSTII